MIDSIAFYPETVPLAFFVWGPVLVMVLFWAAGIWSSRQGVPRMLENDWNGYNAEDVEKLFALYGETHRARYRNRVLPADVAFAFTYAIVGAMLIAGLVVRGSPRGWRRSAAAAGCSAGSATWPKTWPSPACSTNIRRSRPATSLSRAG